MQPRLLFAGFACALSLISCQTPRSTPPVNTVQPLQAQNTIRNRDRFLCVIEPAKNNRSTVKIMDLQSLWVRRIDLPGRVLTLAGDHATKQLFLSLRSGTSNPDYGLYSLDLNDLTLDRPLSFSAANLVPIDFAIRDRKVFVSAKEAGVGGLISNDLDAGGWEYLASHFPAGLLEWGEQPHLMQSVHFGDDVIERTTIDIREKFIVERQRFAHGVPFGNNVGLLSPRGKFFYAFHQLKGEVSLYAFDIESQSVNRHVALQKAVGILYSSVISKDGRYLYATIDNRIERFELQGTFLRRMRPVNLKINEARHLTLSQDQRTLYVTHESSDQISQIHQIDSEVGYRVDNFPLAGKNREVLVF